MINLEQPYRAYTYAYPHKTAYRPITPVPLEQVWANEPKNTFLYLHIPFCEMRCGFCNLFTAVNAGQDLEQGFLTTFERQARLVHQALPNQHVARAAIGGGTPTFLQPADLERVLRILAQFGVGQSTPLSVETSPATASLERLALLSDFGTDRISIGVQSFLESETRSVGRTQPSAELFTALERLFGFGFPNINLDLIYGLPQQTPETWLFSLSTALEFAPQELFLYPLYTRPLTGIEGVAPADNRLLLYRLGRDFLLEHGYTQHSMRVFRAANAPDRDNGAVFDAQADGLIGLGVGARSYTRSVHYASDYAVRQVGVKAIIADYITRPDTDFVHALHGFNLNLEEQKRRFILQSIFHVAGVSSQHYQQHFDSAIQTDFPIVQDLIENNLLEWNTSHLRLTAHGLEYSDAIGPLFYSKAVQRLSEEFVWH